MENHPLKNLLGEVSIHNLSGKVITDLDHYNADAEKIALAVFETLNNDKVKNIIVTTDGNMNIYVVTTYDSFESLKNKFDELYDRIENPIHSKHHFLDVWLEQCSNTLHTGIFKLDKYIISDNSDGYKIAGKNQSYKIVENDDIEDAYKEHLDTYVDEYLDDNIRDRDLRKYFDEDNFKSDIRNEWDNEGGYAKLSSDGIEHTVQISNADMFDETYYILLQD